MSKTDAGHGAVPAASAAASSSKAQSTSSSLHATPSSPSTSRLSTSQPLQSVSTTARSATSSQAPSRPPSQAPNPDAFPQYPSSLSYASVRDFAYPVASILHYGPNIEPSTPSSGVITPTLAGGNEFVGEDASLPWLRGDGPPYFEDDDLQSPVVATRHRKSDPWGTGTNFLNHGLRGERTDGAGPSNRGPYHSSEEVGEGSGHQQGLAGAPLAADYLEPDESRYSRDYQFTIISPDEEFHGKAVALFNFDRENENELQLAEGQVIWVSYRHGHGWLVAEDPKTHETGLVPEEYVRLLRDIEGGMDSLTGALEGAFADDAEGGEARNDDSVPSPNTTIGTNGYHQPVISIFSTSSKDLNPYPTDQLGIQAGQAPPQVVHYQAPAQRRGSQAAGQSTDVAAAVTDANPSPEKPVDKPVDKTPENR